MGMGENRITNANGPIRVLLADDHTMFREGLTGILASYGGMEVVAEVPNDGEALKAMRSFPDPPKVVIVTMFESPRYVRALTGVGASAYLLKTSSSEHLVA